MRKPYIKEEIDYRRQQLASQRIADATEVLEYFTSVMRGEKKDQFGLEAPLSERTKAAQELAKRQIDIPNRIQDKPQAEVKITLDWKRNS
jgi:phage terminase small subunit